MKMFQLIGLAICFLGKSIADTQVAKSPNTPAAKDVYAAFTNDDMHGPSKSTSRIYSSVEQLLSELKLATHLGRNLEIGDARWRASSDYFHQGWLVVTKGKKGIRINVFEQIQGSPQKRFCYVTFFDSETHSKSGMRHSYYYRLPNKKK